MLFLIAQIKRFGTLSATQKTAALFTAPFFKKSENIFKFFTLMGPFRSKFCKHGIYTYKLEKESSF